jgi:hypothetical protein
MIPNVIPPRRFLSNHAVDEIDGEDSRDDAHRHARTARIVADKWRERNTQLMNPTPKSVGRSPGEERKQLHDVHPLATEALAETEENRLRLHPSRNRRKKEARTARCTDRQAEIRGQAETDRQGDALVGRAPAEGQVGH